MNPTLQLIQLSLRVEREAEAQRRRHVANGADLVEEEPIISAERNNHVASDIGGLRYQPCNGCA